MKKILLAAMALGVFAVAPAKNADELRVYINPGHGSWTANDRPNPIVGHGEYSRTNTDTTNFFESNTNLRKGFGVLEMLRAYGLKYDPTLNQTNALPHRVGAALDMHNNIVMSHVKCGPYHEDNGTASQLGDKTPADQEYYNRSLYEISGEWMPTTSICSSPSTPMPLRKAPRPTSRCSSTAVTTSPWNTKVST